MLFISPQKLFSLSRYLSLCLDLLVMYWKGLIIKIKVNFEFYDVTAWLTNNYNTHVAQYFQSIFNIRISTKKQAFDFSKTNSYTNAFLKFPCDAKLITSLLIFWFLVKIWRLFTWVFIYLMILDSWIWTRNFWIWTRNSWIWTLTRGFELAVLNFNSWFYTINSCF